MPERVKLWREDYPHFADDPVGMVEKLLPLGNFVVALYVACALHILVSYGGLLLARRYHAATGRSDLPDDEPAGTDD